MPAGLRRGGLRAGVESLVRDIDVRVHVDVCTERPLPATVETTPTSSSPKR